jgi:hypothetical protein
MGAIFGSALTGVIILLWCMGQANFAALPISLRATAA